MSKLIRLTVLLTLSMVLSGCGANMDDLRSYIAEINARPHGEIAPLPQIKPYETYVYPENLRDPFIPTVESTMTASGSGPRPDPNRNKEALEDFPLDTLRMVGNLERAGEKWSLVKAPDGAVHRVRIGNYLGQSDGRIIHVTDQAIELVELIEDGQGGWIERQASLTLSDDTTEGG